MAAANYASDTDYAALVAWISGPQLDARPRSRLVGLAVAVGSVAAATLIVYPLREVAPAVSTGVVYLLAVLIVSTSAGLRLGLLTALLSCAAFNFFHLPPTGEFTIADGENWVALAVFAAAAAIAGSVADLARSQAQEAEQRRREADLIAQLATTLLGGARLQAALPLAARQTAEALGLASVRLVLGPQESGGRYAAVPLPGGREEGAVGTLLVPVGIDDGDRKRLEERIAPALGALLAAALEREHLLAREAEAIALRRSDEVKTALLRAVSHDLRSPLTAIMASGEALRSAGLRAEDREALASGVVGEAGRLAELVDNLLDLSRLEAGAAEPRRDWCSLEEIVRAAVEELGPAGDSVRITIRDDLPLVIADAAQLQRALANLLRNALAYSDGRPVLVRGAAVGDRAVLRVVDQGPGISIADLPHVFEPFYRADSGAGHGGAGLGLAIVKGFVEINGGQAGVESVPGQGTTFVIELPLPRSRPAKATRGEEVSA
jgi:two-component system sensor histidine kinase KdpD